MGSPTRRITCTECELARRPTARPATVKLTAGHAGGGVRTYELQLASQHT